MPSTTGETAADGWLSQVLLGTLSHGVNQPTFVVLNIALFLAVLCLLALLAICVQSNPDLLPHVAVLIVLACTLWGLIIWFIGVVGFTDTQKQQEQQQEEQQGQEEVAGHHGPAAGTAAAASGGEESGPGAATRRTRQTRRLA